MQPAKASHTARVCVARMARGSEISNSTRTILSIGLAGTSPGRRSQHVQGDAVGYGLQNGPRARSACIPRLWSSM